VVEIPAVKIPAGFTATLRPYQQHGVDWLQHLRAQGLGGFLADDMGLGKTAQTIAHIVIEQAADRLDRPALIVVPTSLVANWTAELAKFAPHLRVVVLHGGERHARRAELADIHVAITTYTVLARDIEEMKLLHWHLVVPKPPRLSANSPRAIGCACPARRSRTICKSFGPNFLS
jgi:SNF2 family DNA or RNA helicase